MIVDRSTRLTHRLAWEVAHSPIPEGMVVMHICDNPACCNLEHLKLGTRAENNRDRLKKGRGPGSPSARSRAQPAMGEERIVGSEGPKSATDRQSGGSFFSRIRRAEIRRDPQRQGNGRTPSRQGPLNREHNRANDKRGDEIGTNSEMPEVVGLSEHETLPQRNA